MEYQIIEYNPYTFVILVKKVTVKGWLFKKVIEDWLETDINGNPYEHNNWAYPRCTHFTNRAAAERRLKIFKGEEVATTVTSFTHQLN